MLQHCLCVMHEVDDILLQGADDETDGQTYTWLDAYLFDSSMRGLSRLLYAKQSRYSSTRSGCDVSLHLTTRKT